MTTRDIKNNIKEASSLSPAARTASANGADVDTRGFESAACVFHPGTLTDGVHTPKLQEKDFGGAYTDVAAEDLEGALVDLASDTPQRVGYTGNKRILRAVITVAGGPGTGIVAGALFILGNPALTPTT